MTREILSTPTSLPHAPGSDTSLAAAEAMLPRVVRLRRQVLRTVVRSCGYGLTPDECADWMGVDRLAVRPRFSELRDDGLLEDSGVRRPNASGRLAAVLVATELGRRIADDAGHEMHRRREVAA